MNSDFKSVSCITLYEQPFLQNFQYTAVGVPAMHANYRLIVIDYNSPSSVWEVRRMLETANATIS